MKAEEELELLNEYAKQKNDYNVAFRVQLSKVAPLINEKPELYDKLSKKSQQIILNHIYLNNEFNDEVVKNKVLKNGAKLTLNGCQLIVLKEHVSEDAVKKIVQNHLNPESWDKCASHVIKEFEKYMNDQQRDILISDYERKTKKQIR